MANILKDSRFTNDRITTFASDDTALSMVVPTWIGVSLNLLKP